MPRFHFNTYDRPDVDGHELPSLAAAKCAAIRMFGAVVCDDADRFWDEADWSMTVTDDRGLTLFQLHLIGTDAAAITRHVPQHI
ncbi:MAG: hypothetical protein ABIQ32_05430 [Sphingomicrobium sp.]